MVVMEIPDELGDIISQQKYSKSIEILIEAKKKDKDKNNKKEDEEKGGSENDSIEKDD